MKSRRVMDSISYNDTRTYTWGDKGDDGAKGCSANEKPAVTIRTGLLLGCGLNVVALEEGVFGIS